MRRFTILPIVAIVALLALLACDRSASEAPSERSVERASTPTPKPSAGTVSSNDKISDAGADH